MTRDVRVTKRLLSVKDVVALPHMFDKTERTAGLKCGCDPAGGALLCGQAGSRVHTGAAKGRPGVAGAPGHPSNAGAEQRRSDSGNVAVRLF